MSRYMRYHTFFVVRKKVLEITKSMRDSASGSDSRVFEVSLTSGCITWANPAAEGACGKIVGASLHGMVLQTHRDRLLEVISEAMAGKVHRRTIWPVRSGPDVLWWESSIIETSGDLVWVACRAVITTPASGGVYDIAEAMSAAAALCASSACEILELRKEMSSTVESFKEEDSETKSHIKAAIRAAGKAADAAMENASALDRLNASISVGFEEHTVEILKLISTDAMHDARMKAFEEHVKKTTTSAVKSIVSQADKAGRGLSKRVTVPVGVIAAVLTFIQWLIVNWNK